MVMSSLAAAVAAAFFLHAAGVSANRSMNEIPFTAKDFEKRDYRFVSTIKGAGGHL